MSRRLFPIPWRVKSTQNRCSPFFFLTDRIGNDNGILNFLSFLPISFNSLYICPCRMRETGYRCYTSSAFVFITCFIRFAPTDGLGHSRLLTLRLNPTFLLLQMLFTYRANLELFPFFARIINQSSFFTRFTVLLYRLFVLATEMSSIVSASQSLP